jgi:hypothetical protein
MVALGLNLELDSMNKLLDPATKKKRFRLWQTRQFPSLDSIAAISVLAAHLYDYEQS